MKPWVVRAKEEYKVTLTYDRSSVKDVEDILRQVHQDHGHGVVLAVGAGKDRKVAGASPVDCAVTGLVGHK